MVVSQRERESFLPDETRASFQETCKRLLYFTVPRVVAVSPQMRLVEDSPASVSLLDIYKQVSDVTVGVLRIPFIIDAAEKMFQFG